MNTNHHVVLFNHDQPHAILINNNYSHCFDPRSINLEQMDSINLEQMDSINLEQMEQRSIRRMNGQKEIINKYLSSKNTQPKLIQLRNKYEYYKLSNYLRTKSNSNNLYIKLHKSKLKQKKLHKVNFTLLDRDENHYHTEAVHYDDPIYYLIISKDPLPPKYRNQIL